METEHISHLPEKCACISSALAHGLCLQGRKRDYFLTFYLQSDWYWIPNICENEQNPSYLFPKWKPIWKIRPLCLCEAGDEKSEQILNPGKFFILDFFLSQMPLQKDFFSAAIKLKRNPVKSSTNKSFYTIQFIRESSNGELYNKLAMKYI